MFETVGYNLEGNELGASFGMIQLGKLDDNIAVRQANFKRQVAFFEKHQKYFINPEETDGANTAWLAFPIQIKADAPFSRRDFQIYLEKRKIQTRVVFTGNINRQPGFVDIPKKVIKGGYPNADRVMERGVLLPCHHGLTDEMFLKLHNVIEEFLEQF